jgi:hypothetical protein
MISLRFTTYKALDGRRVIYNITGHDIDGLPTRAFCLYEAFYFEHMTISTQL